MSPQPSSNEPAEELRVLATARDMAEAVSYLIQVADQAGLNAISQGLAQIRTKLLVIGWKHDCNANGARAPARRRRQQTH